MLPSHSTKTTHSTTTGPAVTCAAAVPPDGHLDHQVGPGHLANGRLLRGGVAGACDCGQSWTGLDGRGRAMYYYSESRVLTILSCYAQAPHASRAAGVSATG